MLYGLKAGELSSRKLIFRTLFPPVRLLDIPENVYKPPAILFNRTNLLPSIERPLIQYGAYLILINKLQRGLPNNFLFTSPEGLPY